MRSMEDIKEARDTAEMLTNYWDSIACEFTNTAYYRGCYSALNWVLKNGFELFADDETNVLIDE